MSHALHLIAKNLPGYGVADKRCLPCSGVSGRAIAISPRSLHGERRIHSQVKIGSLKCFPREASFVCRAGSNGHRRNQDFSKQKRGFRGVNRKNDDKESFETFDDSEPLFSKNGPLPSLSGSSKFQATAAPGQREKEIVELFRKVQAKLRERTAAKEEKKIQISQGKGKENETVDSLLKLLRKHSVEQGRRKGSSGSRGDLNLGHREEDDSYNEDKSSSFLDSNGDLRNEAKEAHSRSFKRPASNFRRRSPIPQVKYQSIYSGAVNSESQLNLNGKSEISSVESPPEYKYEPVLESELEEELDSEDEEELDSEDEKELEPESIYEDTNVFDYVAAASDASDIDDADNDVDEDKQFESEEEEDLSALKVTELRALAKSRGVKGYSKMKKDDLLALLSSSHSN